MLFKSLLLLNIYFCNLLIFNNLSNKKNYKQLSNQVWENKTYKQSVQTVLIYNKIDELSFPVIDPDKNEKIVLSFDELGTEKGDYSWELIHCNAGWEQDDLNSNEYITGFGNGDITSTNFSQNTIINYVNYQLELPSGKDKILKSGNYLIKIFERNNPEKLVLTRRFYVVEPIAEINGNVDQLRVNTNLGLNQRVNIRINYNQGEIDNPSESIILKVFKNQEKEKNLFKLKPSFINESEIKYENLQELCFGAGNEYRHFDIKSIKFLSDRLENIEKTQDGNQVYLRVDDDRSPEDYNYKPDLNGRKLIKLEGNERSNFMADYCNVYFALDTKIPLENGDFYIFGAISDWQTDNKYKMVYDSKSKKFVAKLTVKQGYYNYLILFKSDDDFYKTDDFVYKIEGNHFQTENEYHILAYYRDISSGIDRLVAYRQINSSVSAKY